MRNLSLFRTSHIPLPQNSSAASSISAVTADLDQDVLYVATERITKDADVEVNVWAAEGAARWENEATPDMTLVLQAKFQSFSVASPWAMNLQGTEVVSFKFLPDSRTLVFIMRGGEIATASLDDSIPEVEVVGNVEEGILAAEWSPDDSLLVLATGDRKLILMTNTFDVLSENPLEHEDFGEDAPINVGWGSKQTQFHGSLGKAAAQAPKPAVIGSSPDDDEIPRISWRGDGAFFVVSSLSPVPNDETTSHAYEHRRRTLRMYSHTGVLQTTSEPTPGMEHALSWRPSGNWIVTTQRYGFPGGGSGREGRHDLVMFERNGLRRGDFGLESGAEPVEKVEGSERKWGYRVRELGWSADSNILSIWIEKDGGDVVQLWTTGNYHWYLKHEILAPTSDGRPGRFTSVSWHPEDTSRIILTTESEILQRSYLWDTLGSRSRPPHDSGTIAVLDGTQLLLTPFRTQNVPPPMSSCQLPLSVPTTPASRSRIPVHLCFSAAKDIMAALWESGYVEITDLQTRLGPGRGKIMDPVRRWSGTVVGDMEANEFRQIVVLTAEEGHISFAVLGSPAKRGGRDFVEVVSVKLGELVDRVKIDLPERNGRLVASDSQVWWQSPDGEILSVDATSEMATPISTFPEHCASSEHILVPQREDSSLFLGLTPSGKLYVANGQSMHHLLATNTNSFTIASGFLVYTTTAHVAHFAPLSAVHERLQKLQNGETLLEEKDKSPWETRRVERGSRIVTAVPSTMSLVLQMPRGNLETINPRPLVMEIVKQDIDSVDYAKAFSACRRHRVDLNVFVTHNRESFMQNLQTFVEQVSDVDYINLFLTNLGHGSSPDDVVNEACDGVRQELEKKSMKKYINSILTAHAMKRPPDHEAGLTQLLRLRETDPQLVEDAVKYIIFLVDVDRLFDTALGMYDFSLVLMIAQHAQKDPREYLPFLRELRAFEKFYQRFKIDDHLKRHEKALQNLNLAGDDKFDEAMAYVERHRLYDTALSLWKGTEKYEAVLEVYGDYLFDRREFSDAAFVFRQARKSQKTMLAYERALMWHELFDVAFQQSVDEEQVKDIAYRIAEDLSSKKRYQEAGRVLLDYAKDVREAVIALVQGNSFSEARRITTFHSRPELLEEVIYPGALESRSQIAEELSEMRDQLRKQVQRIRELRVKKVEEPDAFYGTEDNADLHNVDVMTDVSMAPTAFTRYTVAPSAASRTSSKRSSRSKRKMERKVGSGRKGTVDEEEYLLKSVTKLVARFNATKTDAQHLLPHLFQFTSEHRTEGESLQDELLEFANEIQDAVGFIWTKAEQSAESETTPEGWAKRMQEYEKARMIDPLDKVARPELGKFEWNAKLIHVL